MGRLRTKSPKRLVQHLFVRTSSTAAKEHHNQFRASEGFLNALPPIPAPWLSELFMTVRHFKNQGYFEDEGPVEGAVWGLFTIGLARHTLIIFGCIASYHGVLAREQWKNIATMVVEVLRWANRHSDAQIFLTDQRYRDHLDALKADIAAAPTPATGSKLTTHEKYLAHLLWSFRSGIHHTRMPRSPSDRAIFESLPVRTPTSASTSTSQDSSVDPIVEDTSEYGITRQHLVDMFIDDDDLENPQEYSVLRKLMGTKRNSVTLQSFVRNPADPEDIQYKIHRSPLSPRTWIIDPVSAAAIADPDEPKIFTGLKELVNMKRPWHHPICSTPVKGRLALEILHCESQIPQDPEFRWKCRACIRKLSRHLNELPTSLYLHEVVRDGEYAVWGGGFADIWKGKRNDAPVCLKVLRMFQAEEDKKSEVFKNFAEEALIWNRLDHVNVIRFLGLNVSLFPGRFCLISPWMSHGNIMAYLSNVDPEHSHEQVIGDIADGLHYLHTQEPPVVHGDLKGVNVLVTA